MSRRTLLGRGAVLGGVAFLSPWTTGCDAEAVPHKDVATLTGAITSEQNLIATYEAARSADASLAGRLDPVLARHREHLAVLKRHHVPGSGDRAHEGGGAIPAPSAVPIPEGADVLKALRAAEDRAAMARTADAAEAAPGLAQLLASIGACEAGHAMMATGKPPVVRSRSDADAVRAVLEAEHAAVYGYGVLGARLRGPLRQTAQAVWNDHRARRDTLTAVWSGSPVAGAAAYRLPVRVTSVRSAAELAAKLEDALVPAYIGLAGVAAPDLRAFAADGARRARARSAAWRSRTGLPVPRDPFPGLPPAARSPRPVPGE
ncbi:MAG TPA: ferritin-like domain-containing protein [Spirillospora sp.]